MFKVFKTGVVAATLNAGTGADNQGKTAMEADTIQHGRSSTSQKGRGNLIGLLCGFAVSFFLIVGTMTLTTSCGDGDDNLAPTCPASQNYGGSGMSSSECSTRCRELGTSAYSLLAQGVCCCNK